VRRRSRNSRALTSRLRTEGADKRSRLTIVGFRRCEPFEPKLVDLRIAAFVQEARWLSDAMWRMGKAIAGQCDLAIAVGPFCRKGFFKEP